MNQPIDITEHLPEKHRARIIRPMVMTPKAYETVMRVANEMDIFDPKVVLAAVANSASSFITSDYFIASRWFRETPIHPFPAARFERGDNAVSAVLVFDFKSHVIKDESEVTLGEDYPEKRVLEETKVESFPETHVL